MGCLNTSAIHADGARQAKFCYCNSVWNLQLNIRFSNDASIFFFNFLLIEAHLSYILEYHLTKICPFGDYNLMFPKPGSFRDLLFILVSQ